MLALTLLLLLIVLFFIAITITISSVRKEHREVNKRLSDKIDKFEEMFLVECRNLVKSVEDLKV